MRLRLTLCALLLSVSGAFALPPKIELPAEVKPVDGWVRVVPVTDAVSVIYVPLDGLSPFPSEELKDSRRLIVPVHNAKEGKYRFVAVASSKTGEQVRLDFVVLVGTNPKPVDPVVPPKPPTPKVDPPIASEGLRVLIVYESALLSKMPTAQQNIIFSKPMRDYLNDKCVVGVDGKTREFRIWDKDTDAGSESELWSKAFSRPRKEVPWILISNGKTGFEGPLPATVESTKELIKTFEVK